MLSTVQIRDTTVDRADSSGTAGLPTVHPATTQHDVQAALVTLGSYLATQRYTFVTTTPLTHERVLRNRQSSIAQDVRDAFGWNLPFRPNLLPQPLHDTLRSAGLIRAEGDGLYRSQVRFSSMGKNLLAHSGFPTLQEDAVFFGPDTYRFAAQIHAELASRPMTDGARVLDLGCGTGAGGLVAVTEAVPSIQELVLADINPRALVFSRANAQLAQCERCTFVQSDLFGSLKGEFDLIISNPPYLVDVGKRAYRHGGGPHGQALAQRILQQSVARLRPGGRLVLYTGSAVVNGVDLFSEWAGSVASREGCIFTQREIDPDVFGEELERPEYARVDRIAAVSVVLLRPSA